jgi:hypothetical protein
VEVVSVRKPYERIWSEPMVDLNQIVEYNGVKMPIRALPTASLRAEFGYGHFPWDVENRETHAGIGLAEPAYCLDAESTKGVWINFGQTRFCPGCGLDFT